MDSLIQELENLSISKKKPSRKQVQHILYEFEPAKVLVDLTIMKISHAVLSTQEADYCDRVNNVLTYLQLQKNSAEFKKIKTLFAKSNLIVKSVRKVNNPYLKKAFELKRHLCYGGSHPQQLFHGTKEKYVDNICTYNFNWRLGGCEKGHRYGKGVNFSTSAYFATFFCDKNKRKVMIMADVLIDEVKPGNINMVVPPRGSDTTTGKDGTVFVKFYDNEFFPRYVIDFVKVEVK